MKARRFHFDRLILWYLALTFAVYFVSVRFGLIYLLVALSHLATMFWVSWVTRFPALQLPVHGLRAWLRWLYPLLLLVPLLAEIQLLGFVFHFGDTFDHVVRVWDSAVFGKQPHRYFFEILSGAFWRELLHLVYLALYPVVIGAFVLVWRARGANIFGCNPVPYPRFAFVFIGTFCSFVLLAALFPVQGPVDDRFLIFNQAGLLAPVVDNLRAWSLTGGAFPSSITGMTLVLYLLMRPRSVTGRTLGLLYIVLLAVATIYGAMHYAIDVAGGLIAGPLLFRGWSSIYDRLPPEELPA